MAPGRSFTFISMFLWINLGQCQKNSIFSGWEIQYDFSKTLTLGGELYYNSANTISEKSIMAFNLGGSANITEKFHIIFSIGHNLTNKNFISSYTGLLWTI